jgi:hypothetical protein
MLDATIDFAGMVLSQTMKSISKLVVFFSKFITNLKFSFWPGWPAMHFWSDNQLDWLLGCSVG